VAVLSGLVCSHLFSLVSASVIWGS
jgi:hypothetical protein